MAPTNQRLVNASKASPPSKSSPSKLVGEPSTSCRFNLKAFARVFELVAMFLLILDVVLNHKHQIVFATWAAGCLLCGVIVNVVSEKCIYTGGVPGDTEHAASANRYAARCRQGLAPRCDLSFTAIMSSQLSPQASASASASLSPPLSPSLMPCAAEAGSRMQLRS